ncbi:MAG: Ubiquinone/menaquinone biosynthesis C-methyltransferase UbiE [Methanonatronarchaeales archaeon]|nr:Ubiquinone/menaquinone biosynthesis C-methyltransferase UbiE [Methanonatronarchaeales archaeon]
MGSNPVDGSETDSDVRSFVDFCESDLGREVMDREAALLENSIDRRDRVLDVGAGIGSIEERLPGYDVVGLDASWGMLLEARNRSGAAFVQGDAETLPFANGCFDAAFFVATLQFLDDYEAALSEAHRVLRSQGKLVALVLNPESRYVRRHLQKEESYFHRMNQRNIDEIVETVERLFSVDTRYFLGISGDDVFDTGDPRLAATLAIRGEKRDGRESR